jgi:hypothetical protein
VLPPFQALITCGRPKQSASSRTCAYGLRMTVESILSAIAVLFVWGLVLAPLWS